MIYLWILMNLLLCVHPDQFLLAVVIKEMVGQMPEGCLWRPLKLVLYINY